MFPHGFPPLLRQADQRSTQTNVFAVTVFSNLISGLLSRTLPRCEFDGCEPDRNRRIANENALSGRVTSHHKTRLYKAGTINPANPAAEWRSRAAESATGTTANHRATGCKVRYERHLGIACVPGDARHDNWSALGHLRPTELLVPSTCAGTPVTSDCGP